VRAYVHARVCVCVVAGGQGYEVIGAQALRIEAGKALQRVTGSMSAAQRSHTLTQSTPEAGRH
jgi:hypothetical protein